jgi:hypothetical protein
MMSLTMIPPVLITAMVVTLVADLAETTFKSFTGNKG